MKLALAGVLLGLIAGMAVERYLDPLGPRDYNDCLYRMAQHGPVNLSNGIVCYNRFQDHSEPRSGWPRTLPK